MVRYIWIGILSNFCFCFCFCFNPIFGQKLHTSAYIDIEGNKKSFLSKVEVDIDAYRFFLYMAGKEYGENSEQYIFLIPDTVKFRAWYGFPFSFFKNSSPETTDLYRTLPMVAISYEQALAYCQWVEALFNTNPKQKHIWKYSLPKKADYETAFNPKKAKITQRESLSPLQVKSKKRCCKTKDSTMCIVKCHYDNFIYGLTDNVAEYTQDGMVVKGGENTALKFVEPKDYKNPIGFRIKLTVVSKKSKK